MYRDKFHRFKPLYAKNRVEYSLGYFFLFSVRRVKWIFLAFLGLLLAVSTAYAVVRELHNRRLTRIFEEMPRHIVSQMSLEEKVGQLLHIGVRGRDLTAYSRRLLRRCRVGGIILFAYNLGRPEEIRNLTEKLQKEAIDASGIPLLISTDQEGGRIRRVPAEGTVQFPGAMALGQTENPRYAEEVGFITGYELGKLGINWVLAPVLDVNNNPQNPVINLRSFGSQPQLVGRMGVAYLKGNRAALSVATIKHFPGHGDTDLDSHFALPVIAKSLAELETVELLPFQQAIDAGAEVLMTAHILFPSLDKKHPATLSQPILTELLRRKMGFKGLITTDAMEMQAITKHYKLSQALYLSFNAGVDILLFTKEGKLISQAYQTLLKAFRSGKLAKEKLDRAVERQISLKYRRGLFYRYAALPLKNRQLENRPLKNEPLPNESLKNESLKNESLKNEPLQNEPLQNELLSEDRLLKDQLIVKEHFAQLEREAEERYLALQQSYLQQGTDINTHISRAAVRSLRKSFTGLSSEELQQARMLLKSRPMLLQAKRMGIAAERLKTFRRCRDLLTALQRKQGELWIVEVPLHCRRTWNRLAKIQNRSQERRFKDKTIALYTGNPFLPMLIPDNGYVLASFSNTKASQSALLFRVVSERQTIKEANLMLSPP